MTTPVAERAELLRIARRGLTIAVGGAVSDLLETHERVDATALTKLAGAFVTLRKDGALRGCIGHVEADQPLIHVVFRCAAAAASDDPRFPSVTAAELAEVDIEISILGPLEELSSLDDLVIGRHGLLVERDDCRGLLLPQVAVEWHWTTERFLAEACRKAGLAGDAWPLAASAWRFEAEVFGEQRF
jgi:AmmeMemoRadiSam system protein A